MPTLSHISMEAEQKKKKKKTQKKNSNTGWRSDGVKCRVMSQMQVSDLCCAMLLRGLADVPTSV